MTRITRQYRLHVLTGEEQAFLAALHTLVEALRGIPGFEEAALLQDTDHPAIHLFCERWASQEAYRDGASLLPKIVFAKLMQTLAAPPEGASFTAVPLDKGD